MGEIKKKKETNEHNEIPAAPFEVPFFSDVPEGLAIAYTAANSAEADMVRQMLQDAGFHVEYVASYRSGVWIAGSSVHVYIHADEVEEARLFLRQLNEKAAEEQSREDE